MTHKKHIFFPFGIFILFLVLFSGGAVLSSGVYFYVKCDEQVTESEQSVQNALIPVLDACVQIAELDGGKDSAARLDRLFRDYRAGNTVFKAFFVKEDGTILAHSDQEEARNLKNNIASDEFTYNLEQIFLPMKSNMKEPYFSDYYLMEKKLPFSREQTGYLKEYLYSNIDRNGWILARQTVYNGKPFGVIAFFADKQHIYDFISVEKDAALYRAKAGAAAGAGVSLLLSLVVFLRYRMIYNKAARQNSRINEEGESCSDYSAAEHFTIDPDAGVASPSELSAETHTPELVECGGRGFSQIDPRYPVQDAIPVRKK